jgi:sec-independent protein translocase protein TatA
MTPTFGLFTLSPMEILIILGIGVLLFGRKLPDVGRYLGKGIVEFKKGMKGLEDDVDPGAGASPRTTETLSMQPPPPPPQRVQTGVPKFEDSPNNITTPPKA